MNKTALIVFSMALFATMSYADDADTTTTYIGRGIGMQALSQFSDTSTPGSAQIRVIKKNTPSQEQDAWTIRSLRENENSR
jgi:hypothetical protein